MAETAASGTREKGGEKGIAVGRCRRKGCYTPGGGVAGGMRLHEIGVDLGGRRIGGGEEVVVEDEEEGEEEMRTKRKG